MTQSSQINIGKGWNAALEMVCAALNADELVSTATPDQERLRTSVLDLLSELAIDEDLLKPKRTNAELAEKYSISPRTVTNWRNAGCPFDGGQWQVMDWMAEQRYVPARARAKFARQLGRRTGIGLQGIEALSFQVKQLAETVRALSL